MEYTTFLLMLLIIVNFKKQMHIKSRSCGYTEKYDEYYVK